MSMLTRCDRYDLRGQRAAPNNTERALRGPVIGRGMTFGSNKADGAKFTAIMPSVVDTLSMHHGIEVFR